MSLAFSRLLPVLLGVYLSSGTVPLTVVTRRYPDGKPMYQRSYLNGYEEGTHRGWWSDGTPHFVYHYVHGRLEGEALEWFPNGGLYRDFHYQAGQESGREKMWYPDGKLHANYVMVNGRRYGLPGSKGCVAAADSAGAAR